MSYNARLEKMLADGVITADQAKGLQESIAKVAPTQISQSHHHVEAKNIALVVGGLTVVGMVVAALQGQGGAQSVEQIQKVADVMNQPGATGGLKGMGASTLTWIVLGLPVIGVFIAYMPFVYNRCVALEAEMLASIAHMKSCYQKRADLLPNLIALVKNYMQSEEKTHQGTAQERSGNAALGTAVEALEALAAAPADDLAAQKHSATKLLAVMEDYPDLRSVENVLSLQQQLENVEEQINTSRLYFNEAVRDYNKAVTAMPGCLIASLGGFKSHAYFERDVAAQQPVSVETAA